MHQFFVYGTLKRGQCREHAWPIKPVAVVTAYCFGQLYGRRDYPAMIEGCDRVLGELWQFNSGDVGTVIARLDQIEGTNQPGQDDLYQRKQCEVMDLDDTTLGVAWTYHYAHDLAADGFARIASGNDGYVAWPAVE